MSELRKFEEEVVRHLVDSFGYSEEKALEIFFERKPGLDIADEKESSHNYAELFDQHNRNGTSGQAFLDWISAMESGGGHEKD